MSVLDIAATALPENDAQAQSFAQRPHGQTQVAARQGQVMHPAAQQVEAQAGHIGAVIRVVAQITHAHQRLNQHPGAGLRIPAGAHDLGKRDRASELLEQFDQFKHALSRLDRALAQVARAVLDGRIRKL
ncbi:hypothetical protein D3C85_1467900 [compost metagenome]